MKKTKTNVRMVTWNLGTLNESGAEVTETSSWQEVDICDEQKHRLTASLERNQVHMLTGKKCKFKFFYAQVGILLAENLADKVIEVQHISDRIILLKLIIGKEIFSLFHVPNSFAY